MKRIIPILIMCIMLLSCEKVEAPSEPEVPSVQVIENEDFTLKVDRDANTVEVLLPEELAGCRAEFTKTGAYLISGDIKIPLGEKVAERWKRWLDEDTNTAETVS